MPIIKTNLLIVYVEIVADYCENHTKHINIMRRHNAASLMLQYKVHNSTGGL